MYNKRKRMKSKWMTDVILKSIKSRQNNLHSVHTRPCRNTMDKLYTILIQTDTEDEHLYTRLKSEFITHCTVLR